MILKSSKFSSVYRLFRHQPLEHRRLKTLYVLHFSVDISCGTGSGVIGNSNKRKSQLTKSMSVDASSNGQSHINCNLLPSCSKILYINSSGSDSNSYTTLAYKEFYKIYKQLHPKHKVLELNLWDPKLLKYNLSHVASKMRMTSGDDTEDDKENFASVKAMVNDIFSADKLIISSPMWNYSVPYVLKQYIDCVIQPGLTFKETPSGAKGLLKGRPLLLITSSGSDFTKPEMKKLDFQVPYLKAIFGLIGFSDISHIYIKNTANSNRETLIKILKGRAKEEAENF